MVAQPSDGAAAEKATVLAIPLNEDGKPQIEVPERVWRMDSVVYNFKRACNFSSHAPPKEASFRDDSGNWVIFRGHHGSGHEEEMAVDYIVNGELRVSNLTRLWDEGDFICFEGEGAKIGGESARTGDGAAPEYWPSSDRVRVPGGAGDALAPKASPRDILTCLDRDRMSSEPIHSGQHTEHAAIIHSVLALWNGRPEESDDDGAVDDDWFPHPEDWCAPPGSRRSSVVAGFQEDRAPRGFVVRATQHAEGRRDPISHRWAKHVTDGKFFFFDKNDFPDFEFRGCYSYHGDSLEVEQYREGRFLWTGLVSLYENDENDVAERLPRSALGDRPRCTARGHRCPIQKAEEGQWKVGDVMVVLSYHVDTETFSGNSYIDNLERFEGGLPRVSGQEEESDPSTGRSSTTTPRVGKSPRVAIKDQAAAKARRKSRRSSRDATVEFQEDGPQSAGRTPLGVRLAGWERAMGPRLRAVQEEGQPQK